VFLGADTNKAKKRRFALDATLDNNWFSTPPPGNSDPDAAESAHISQATPLASGSSNLPPSVQDSSPGPCPPPSPTRADHPQIVNNAESSTAGAAPRQSTPTVKYRALPTYAYKTTPSDEPFASIDLISPLESPTAIGLANAGRSKLKEAPADVGHIASDLPSRSSSEPQNDDDGIVMKCPRPGKPKSTRKKKREEQKRLAALSVAAVESPSVPTEIAPAAPAIAKTEDDHNGLAWAVSPARKETSPDLVADAQAISNERSGAAKESSGDNPDSSMPAGIIVNGVSHLCEIVAHNDGDSLLVGIHCSL